MGIQSVKGLVALVTGGAAGFGFATTQRLLKQGAKVILCDLPNSKGPSVAEKAGENCIFAPVDVTSEVDVKKALDTTKSKFGRLDVVVNCAGISLLSKTYDYGNLKPHSLDDFWNMLKVNVVGTFNVTRLAVGLISENQPNDNGQRGVVVNTSSTHGYEGSTGHVAFAASSRCIGSMTLPFARDLSEVGIRCCAVAPGLFDTNFFRKLPEKYRRYMPSVVPFPKGLGNPDEFSHTVQAIIENPYMNGEVIRVDGALRWDL